MYLEERMIKMIDIGQECFTNETLSTWKETIYGSNYPLTKHKYMYKHHLTSTYFIILNF